MKTFALIVLLGAQQQVSAFLTLQNPCADCTVEHALRYQACTRDFGDACVEQHEVTVHKLDYLGQKICEMDKKDKCILFDATSGSKCPKDWKGNKDWKTDTE